MPFLIDGYNLLWALEGTNSDLTPSGDIQLCKVLSRYLTSIDDTGQIVFDGIGPPDKDVFENLSKLEVIFSGTKNDADTIIERKIEASTAPKRLTVVSSDNRIRRAARARKAVSIKSALFWSQVRKQLRRPRGSAEPAEKRVGLSQSETEQWMDFFGLDK